MSSQKAFWQALATVGVTSVFVWGLLFYMFGLRAAEWPIYCALVLATCFFLVPILYRKYLKDPLKQKTKDDYLKSAIMSGCVAITFVIVAWMDPESGWRGIAQWGTSIAWAAITLQHLILASKAEKTRYIAHE